jgi:hypothetical protein
MSASQRKRSGTARREVELEPALATELARGGGPVFLKRQGRATGVALDMKSYRTIMSKVDKLESIQGIQRGIEDFKAGRSMSLEQFRRRMEGRFALSHSDRRKRSR